MEIEDPNDTVNSVSTHRNQIILPALPPFPMNTLHLNKALFPMLLRLKILHKLLMDLANMMHFHQKGASRRESREIMLSEIAGKESS